MQEFIETMLSFLLITTGIINIIHWIHSPTIGLLSTKLYNFVPIKKLTTILPFMQSLFSYLFITPASTNSTTPSEIISECMPKSFFIL